jgi:predicted ATP-grasp superfamily ATP-dependent carboligase
LKIFVCEYITGGGLYREPLPLFLAKEGAMMRDAVLHDLGLLKDVTVCCAYDQRTPLQHPVAEAIPIRDEEVWELWGECVSHADAVLPIAPETGGILLSMSELVSQHEKVLLGCSAGGIRVAGSKYSTYQALHSAGLNAVPTFKADMLSSDMLDKWVAKPDDGVGCEGSFVFDNANTCKTWMADRGEQYIAQPYVEGTPASLCMLCKAGQAWLLSCNRQLVEVRDGSFLYEGSVVNGMAAYWDDFSFLAQHIAQAIPSLSGYIGVDVIVSETGIAILEINPRITTSYVGLNQAMGHNPAELLIELLYNQRFEGTGFTMPALDRNVVKVSVGG